MASEQTSDRRVVVAILVLVVVGGVFVLTSWSRIGAAFGDSDEGINSAVWAYNSRSLRELGPITSALGGKRLDTTDYATHPPLIVLETAVAETVAGEHELASRAPAWIASLVSLVLFYRLARSLGADELTAAAAATATAATSMFWVYGVMLDTPVTSFPFGLGVALLWHRDWRGERVSPWLVAGVALLACLAGWQSGLLVGLCGVSLAVRKKRAAIPYLATAVVGLALSVGWGWWAYGSLDALRDKFTRRTGSPSGVSIGDVVSFQMPWLLQLLGVAAIGIVGCAVALRDKRFRPLAALSLSVVGLYCLLFREAAAGHQYWIYWSLFSAAIGLTYVFEALGRAAKNVGLSATGASAAVLAVAVVMGVIDVGRGTDAQTLIAEGERPVQQLQASTLPPGDAVYYVGQRFRPDSWIVYYTGRHGQFITSNDDVARLARDQPDTPVFVIGVCDESDSSYRFCKTVTGEGTGDGRPARQLTAAALARELGVTPAAPASSGGPPPLPPPGLSAP